MSDPLDVGPRWQPEVVAWHVILSLGPAESTGDGPSTLLYLDIDEGEVWDDDGQAHSFSWRYGVDEEEAGFGEAEYESGLSDSLMDAQTECWSAVVNFLRGEGYNDQEIANAALD